MVCCVRWAAFSGCWKKTLPPSCLKVPDTPWNNSVSTGSLHVTPCKTSQIKCLLAISVRLFSNSFKVCQTEMSLVGKCSKTINKHLFLIKMVPKMLHCNFWRFQHFDAGCFWSLNQTGLRLMAKDLTTFLSWFHVGLPKIPGEGHKMRKAAPTIKHFFLIFFCAWVWSF